MLDSLIIAEEAHRKYLLDYYQKQQNEIDTLYSSLELHDATYKLVESEEMNLNDKIDGAKSLWNKLNNVLLF